MPNLPPGPYIYRDGYVRDANGKAVADVKRLRKLQAEEVAVAELLIRAEQRERTGGWIANVSQKPRLDDRVLVASPEGIVIGQWFHGEWWGPQGRIIRVTHWQPLPEPPTC